MIWLIMIGLSLAFFSLYWQQRQNPLEFLTSQDEQLAPGETTTTRALNIAVLTDEPLRARIKIALKNHKARIGNHFALKVVLFLVGIVIASVATKQLLPDINIFLLLPALLVIGLVLVIQGLKVYEKKQFEAAFPDALNMLTGAISSGESLMHGIIFVGDSLSGMVGKEFKLMGQRLSMGQPADEVLSQSCERFPYPSFYFFAIALRANINRGGQLKEIIRRLNQIMFDNQTLEKKKKTVTAEARMSAWIVAAIPFCFMIMMKFMSPDNFDFVMYEDEGRPILYYVLASELFGLGIIYFLMKRVQS